MDETQRQLDTERSHRDADGGEQVLRLTLPARLNAETTAALWTQWVTQVRRSRASHLVLEGRELKQCDGCGFGLLSYLRRMAHQGHKSWTIEGLSPNLAELLERYTPDLDKPASEPQRREGPLTVLGRLTTRLAEDIYEQLCFLGHLAATVGKVLLRPTTFRWRECCRIAELAGADALGIVCLLGFLFGLIMSFSSAMPMRQFNVEIYVVDLVAFALTRVLGPFITAILMAGRTGSAFAAELGTMKINNELDALEVMNLNPMSFLVLPRVCATVAMAPLLTVATNLVGLLGCALVILSMGYPLATFWSHVQNILSGTDVMVGLFKALVFGGIVGAVGCLRGLQTQAGAGAVGISTTRAVVTSIVLLVLAEGLFSVLLYVLEL